MSDYVVAFSRWLLAWGIVYNFHSTIFFALTWVAHRYSKNDTLKLAMWQFALVGGLLTATLVLLNGQWVPDSPRLVLTPSPLAVIDHTSATTTGIPTLDSETISLSSESAASVTFGEWAPWVCALWLSLSIVTLARLAFGYYRLHRLVSGRYSITESSLLSFADALRGNASIPCTLALSTVDALTVPLVLPSGEICVPRRVMETLTFPQQQSVLAHEVAHIVHKDHWWRLLSQFVSVVVPFQLFNRYGTHRIQELSEYRADAWATRYLPSPLPLVQSLVSVAEWTMASGTISLVTAMAVRPSTLQQRVERLLRPAPRSSFSRIKLGIEVVIVVMVLMLMTPTRFVLASLAVSASDPNTSPEPALPVLALPTKPPVEDTSGNEDKEFPRNPHATLPPLPTARPTSVVTPTPRPTIHPIEANTPFALRWPVDGRITVQPSRDHMALDIADEAGTPIMAAAAGTVLQARWDDKGYGYMLLLKHEGKYTTLYAHLQSLTVETGDVVEAGDMIARMGDTGNVTGPALHFEVRESGARVNPYNYLP